MAEHSPNVNLRDDVSVDDNADLDINFYQNDLTEEMCSKYFEPENLKTFFTPLTNNFSLLHVNIRSMQKNFEKLLELLHETQHNFSVICLTETWASDDTGICFETNGGFTLVL